MSNYYKIRRSENHDYTGIPPADIIDSSEMIKLLDSYSQNSGVVSNISDDELLKMLENRGLAGVLLAKDVAGVETLDGFLSSALSGKIKLLFNIYRADQHKNTMILMHYMNLISEGDNKKFNKDDLVKITTVSRILIAEASKLLAILTAETTDASDYYVSQLIVIHNMLVLKNLELLSYFKIK